MGFNTTLCMGSIVIPSYKIKLPDGFQYNTLYGFNENIEVKDGVVIPSFNTTLCMGSIDI